MTSEREHPCPQALPTVLIYLCYDILTHVVATIVIVCVFVMLCKTVALNRWNLFKSVRGVQLSAAMLYCVRTVFSCTQFSGRTEEKMECTW